MATATDAILTFDLRTQPKKIIVEDAIDYGVLGWDINDVVCVITFTGPEGVIYGNTDYNNPDIVPATSRFLNKTIALPLDPETEYEEVLHGNYTLKVTWYNSVLEATEVFLETYSFTFNEPVIENTTVSGPYSGTLTSTDDTDYGSNVFLLTREHRIQYPTQLPGPPADIVSSLAEVVVDPIYTNQWTIIITSSVEYRNPDLLRILWDDSDTFYHCVYGSCIESMQEVIDTALQVYIDDTPAQAFNQEAYQKRLVTINVAWHLLNVAYQQNNVEEADKQSYVIQEAVEWTGSGTCGGSTSELVIPCPPYVGGTGPGVDYEFTNGLTEVGGVPPQVKLGGTLIENTTINTDTYTLLMQGSSGGSIVNHSVSVSNGVLSSHSNSSTEGRVYVESDKVTLERADIVTPANTRGYEVTSNGLVEKADYTSGYVDRTLVAKSYVDDSFLLKTDGSFNAYTEKAVPVNDDIILIEDSATGYVKKKIKVSSLAGGVGVSTFLELTDTFSSYAGLGSQALIVNSAEDAVETQDLTLTYLHIPTAGQIEGLTNKAVPVGADKIIIEDSEDSWNKKEINLSDIPIASTTFISQSDTPSSYTGFGGYYLVVNGTEDAVEFTSAGFVPVTGGTFTGVVTFATTNSRSIVVQKTGSGGSPGIPEGALNLISFKDGDGDEQGYVGIDASGNLVLKTSVSGAKVYADGNFDVNGNITLTGTVDGVDIAAFKAAYDIHTHDFTTDITGKPTTLAGYGITDAITTITADFANQFTEKSSGVAGDRIVIEDSADSYAKKYLQVGNLPTSALAFTSLTDVPSTYSGQGDYLVRVTTAETGLEFFDADGLWISTAAGTLNALTQKVTPTTSDILIIEDAADSYTQKKITISSLPVSGGGGSGITSIEHRYDSTTTDGDPGNGFFRLNNATLSSVTFIYIDNLNWWGSNVRTILANLASDDILYIQQVGSSDRAVTYQLSGSVDTSNANYIKIPVSYVSATSLAIQANQNCGFITHYEDPRFTYSLSVVESSGAVSLTNDVASPGNSYYYGTNASGVKGWYLLDAGTFGTFVSLTDTPSSYAGNGLKGVRVNSGATALEFYTITSYTFPQSVNESSGTVTLVNDVLSPGASKYYGTNASSAKGWYDLPSGSVSFGAENQIPTVNSTTDDFDYDANFTWNATTFELGGNYNTLSSATILRSTTLGTVTENNNIRESYSSGKYFMERYYAGSWHPMITVDNEDSGNANIFIGDYTGDVSTSAYGTVAIGSYALSKITNPFDNTGVGYAAGNNLTTGGGNTLLGSNTGNSLTTANGCVFVGYSAGTHETGSNKFFVDNQSRTNEAIARVSSLFYGEFNATPSSQLFRINAGVELTQLSTGYKSGQLCIDTTSKVVYVLDDTYTALTSNSSVSWDTSAGLNKTWSINGSYTLTFTNFASGMSGDVKITVTSAGTITLAASGVTFKGNGSLTSLSIGTYHLAWVCTSATTIEWNIALYT